MPWNHLPLSARMVWVELRPETEHTIQGKPTSTTDHSDCPGLVSSPSLSNQNMAAKLECGPWGEANDALEVELVLPKKCP